MPELVRAVSAGLRELESFRRLLRARLSTAAGCTLQQQNTQDDVTHAGTSHSKYGFTIDLYSSSEGEQAVTHGAVNAAHSATKVGRFIGNLCRSCVSCA